MVGSHSGKEHDPIAWMWVAFIVVSSLLLSRAFACATPFAAVAAVAACTLRRRIGATTVLLVWAGNQATGFGWLHYPLTASSFGWGAALGIAALTALAAARMSRHWTTRGGVMAAAVVALCAGFAAYEAVLVAATAVLASGSDAFAPMVILRIFGIDAVAFGLLLAAHRLAQAAGMPMPRSLPERRG